MPDDSTILPIVISDDPSITPRSDRSSEHPGLLADRSIDRPSAAILSPRAHLARLGSELRSSFPLAGEFTTSEETSLEPPRGNLRFVGAPAVFEKKKRNPSF